MRRILLASITILAATFSGFCEDDDFALCADLAKGEIAVAACTRLVEAGQRPPEELARAHSFRAMHRMRTGDTDAALADFNAAIRLREKATNTRAAADLVERANQHHANSEWKAAVADASEALELDPNSAEAYNVRGDALTQLREFDRAIADLTQAIRLAPQMRVAYINRGAAYEESGRDDLALADYDTVTALYPDWEVGHRVRYEILLKHGRHAEAIPSLTKRSELLPAHVYILAERAEAYRAMQDFERALADYDEAIKRSPKDARFWQGRALLHHARGDNARALADLTAGIEVAPNARDLYIDRARVYRALGDVAAAEADESRVRNVPRNWPDPGEFLLFFSLGLLLSWPKAILCTAAAVFIRHRVASMATAAAVGVAETAWPMLDIFTTAAGIVPLILSALAGLAWWGIGRALYGLVR